MKKTLAILMVFCMCLLTACSTGNSNSSETNVTDSTTGAANNGEKYTLKIAYQYGMAYAPLIVMQEQKLIEKYCDNVEVNWQVLNSGAAINEGVIAGDIQVAYMGIAPFLTAVMKGTPYKLYSGLSGQPMGLNTNDANITSLADFTADDKIALVNYGSIQHIMLAMAAEKELGDAHALDENIMAMAHPDGMQALISNSVKGHLTTAPYFLQELEDDQFSEITSVRETFPEDCTIIIGAAANDLYENHREVYDALVSATNEAMDYINNNLEDTAEMIYENEGVSKEVMLEYMKADGVIYTNKATGLMEIADFMKRAEFIEEAPAAFSDISFEGVQQ